MATYDFTSPAVSTASATKVIDDIKAIAEASAVMWNESQSLFYVPTNAVRWNTSSKLFQLYNGASWGNLEIANIVGSSGVFAIDGTRTALNSSGSSELKIIADNGNTGTTTYDPIATFNVYATERARIYTDTSDSHKLKFDVGGSDQMVIDSSGNVGIGTSSPSYRLEVSDSNTTATQFSLDNTSTSGRNFRFLSTGSASGIGVGKFSIYDGDADGHRLVINSSGNVGIGTSSPNHIVHIKETANSTTTANLILDSIVQYGYEAGTFEVRREDYYVSSFGGVWEDNDNSYARIGIRHSGSTVYPLTIRDNRIGIGTSSPSEKLEVDGGIRPKSYTVATLPSATNKGTIIYVTDETGGEIPCFADGTNFRRMSDRAIVSS